MSSPIQFDEFYTTLALARDGNKEKVTELEWMLAEYEHAKESKGAYDELGQVFCHIGVMELYTYTGVEDLSYIYSMRTMIWDYLKEREGSTAQEALIKAMVKHAKEHSLPDKIASKWKFSEADLAENLDNLAEYITDGIIDIVIN